MLVTEWQPIETAPRDGTPFLAYSPEPLAPYSYDGDEGWDANVLMVRWSRPNNLEGDRWITPHVRSEMFSGSEFTGSWSEYENLRCQPTHWMPLPPVPEHTEESA